MRSPRTTPRARHHQLKQPLASVDAVRDLVMSWSGAPGGNQAFAGAALNIIDSSANRPGVGVLPPGDQREACANGGRAAPDAGYRRRVAV